MSPEAFEDFKAAVLSDLTQEDTSLVHAARVFGARWASWIMNLTVATK